MYALRMSVVNKEATYLWLLRWDVVYVQGKFIRINFDSSGYIAGANIESCIL